jgi:hypothetical protein
MKHTILRIGARTIRPRGFVLLIAGFLLAIILAGAGAILYTRYVRLQTATTEQMKAESEKELGRITAMQESVFVRRDFLAKGEHGVVTDNYRSGLDSKMIRSYYDKEFLKNGWKFLKEENLPVWGKDIGAIQTSYCKRNLKGYIYLLGAQTTKENITYTLGISWGLDGCTVNASN